ncbi:MAG: tryptophan 2,3-dioxygenase [Myxococcales bacterium]|nr:tryptophan 2,3-dioxygenase [Myxococcales bacterium]
MGRKPTSYWDYVGVDRLLALQGGIDKDESDLANDEVLFIVVHQIDELWFKLAIRELVSVRDLFARNPVPEQSLASAVRGLRRLEKLFHQVSTHFSLMETMTTRDYLAFRDKLSPASGFQSGQLREVEILLGLRDEDRIPLGHEHSYLEALKEADGTPSPAYERVVKRLEDRPSVREAVHDWIYRTPIQGSRPEEPGDSEVVRTFIDSYCAAQGKASETARTYALEGARTDADRARLTERFAKETENAKRFLLAEELPEADRVHRSRVRAALVFIESYRELPLLAWPREVLDAIVALEQAFVIFRQRHARMVERVIGRRTGTGGSAGVDYLDQTALKYRVFDDIWAVRTLLLPERALPPLAQPEVYGFATET